MRVVALTALPIGSARMDNGPLASAPSRCCIAASTLLARFSALRRRLNRTPRTTSLTASETSPRLGGMGGGGGGFFFGYFGFLLIGGGSRQGSDVVGCAQPSERSARRIACPYRAYWQAM